jgi:hypothetical protein
MAKFCGAIGFVKTIETRPGVWEEQSTEKKYYGDVIKNTRRWDAASGLNDNLNINNQISIIADPYASLNFHSMRYIEFMGTPWIITNVEVAYPRLILTIGGEYNGKQT